MPKLGGGGGGGGGQNKENSEKKIPRWHILLFHYKIEIGLLLWPP